MDGNNIVQIKDFKRSAYTGDPNQVEEAETLFSEMIEEGIDSIIAIGETEEGDIILKSNIDNGQKFIWLLEYVKMMVLMQTETE